MIAAIHIDPRITIPIAIVLAAIIVWYWVRLGREDVPPSRRRVRRWSMMFMFVSLAPFVRVLSFLDTDIQEQARDYVLLWSAIIVLILLVITTAVIDALVSVRLQRQLMEREITKASGELMRALSDATDPRHEDRSA